MKKFTLFVAALLVSVMSMAAVGDVFYTFSIKKDTRSYPNNNSQYAVNYDVDVNGLVWSVPGNQTVGDYARVGGKYLDGVSREIFSKDSLVSEVAKVTLNHAGITNAGLTINYVSLIVASDTGYTKGLDTVKLTPTFEKSKTDKIDFVPSKGEKWAAKAYYKLIINCTNSSKNNYGLDVVSMAFYSYKSDSEPSITAQNVDFGKMDVEEAKDSTMVLSVVGANLTETIAYSWKTGDLFSATGALTNEGGNLTISILANEAGEVVDSLILTSGSTIAKYEVKATLVKFDGNGTKEKPYSIADVIALNNPKIKAWVQGVIIGCAVNGGGLAASDVDTNILLGANDSAKTGIPVALPAGDIRDALNIVDNPTYKGASVKVYGSLESYFITTGIKSTSDYAIVSVPTALDQVEEAAKAVKVVENGQLFILREGVRYNLAGQVVR